MDDPTILLAITAIVVATTFHFACYQELINHQRQPIHQERCFNPWSNEELFNESHFIGLFQMGCHNFFALVCLVRPHVRNGNNHDVCSLTIEEKVGVMLYRVGHGSLYETVGHLFNIGKSMAYYILQNVVQAILEALHDVTIIFPNVNDNVEWEHIKETFKRRQGITNIIEAIDGTHIPIIPLPNEQWNSNVNRKGWHSIALQCIVDGNGNFCNVYEGLPGSVHDSRMFRKSQTGKDLINGIARFPQDCLLIWDSGYSLKLPILTPSRNQHDAEHICFNHIHSLTRMVIEQLFGQLKNRFHCLLAPQSILPLYTTKVTIACMILHNLLNGKCVRLSI
ncbi:hypothetical protein O181_025676 [Austropuccinia psidii MF-1]|uniref:DDE Tnp4 domain-containing protein n=1 Tax=Austropuccinia psidii MF-1 TaxID=1389203 RepID=A0A9Q3CNW7_9BASI|nr:hypothetical protein [Austropuccinia psidii MF-1]